MAEEVGDRQAIGSAMQQLGMSPRPRQTEDGEEADAEKVKIEVPKEPEVDPFHYRDVESLLFRGFILLPAEINGVRFIFKSMNHHEFEYLQWIASGYSQEQYNNTFLALGVFMIDGQNILPTREKYLPTIEEAFSTFPESAHDKLVRFLSDVNRKAAKAVALTEAYQMERVSRFRWAQLSGIDLMSPMNTGVDGTQRLGLNYAQLVWRALNYFDDHRETAEREWDNAKFIGSCFAGKEIKKIYSQDKDRRDKEKTERINRKDQLLRQVLLGEEISTEKGASQYQIVTARTVEELASQLERDLRGEKDWHDMIVDREEARLRESERARLQHMRDMHRASVQDHTQDVYGGSDASRGYSPEEIRERIVRQRQLSAQRQAAGMVYDERMETFLRKYGIDDEPEDAPPIPTTDRDPTHAQPVVPTRPPGTPFRRG